jgi:ABC-type transport system involved in multi-copper enzyme maturation permease subunit
MMGLIRSEFRKISTVRMTYVLLISSILLTATYITMYALLAGFDNGSGQTLPPLTSEMSVRMVYSSIGAAYIIVLVFGIIGFTNEIRHRTVTLTYLATPHRGNVIAAKFVAHGVWGIIFAAANVVIGVPLAMWLVNSREHFEIPLADIWAVSIGTLAAFALYAILGVAIGALVRNQIGAIVGALVWVMFIEAIFIAIIPDVGKWMPAGAASAMLQARALDGAKYLEPVQGGLLLAGYAIVFGVIAAFTTNRKDVS